MSKPRVYYTMAGGAGDEVTGSRHILRIEYNNKVLNIGVDFGIIQGENEYKNFMNPVKGESLDFILITHAHSDHFLGLPLLKGFKGKILGTASSLVQGRELLNDAAYRYECDAAEELGITYEVYRAMCSELENIKRRENHNDLERYNDLLKEIEAVQSYALYNSKDVEEIAKHFCALPPYRDFMLADGVYVRFIPNTHQNGAVSVELYVGDFGENSINISFSGDIGPNNSFLYKKHKYPKNNLINFCVAEALHGMEKREQTPEEAYREIKKIFLKAIKENKTIIAGGFALDRLAMLLYSVNRMIDDENISIPIYFDSPLAFRELMHYRNDYATRDSHWFKDLGKNPFDINEVIVTNKHADHMSVVRDFAPKIVLTTSAFGEGGRICDYFSRYIQDDNAIFLFACWLKPGCSSYKLHNTEKGKIVEIHEHNYVKHCETYQISGFTGHGYYEELTDYIDGFPKLKNVILNHAESEAKEAVAEELSKEYPFKIYTPDMCDAEANNFFKFEAGTVEEIPTHEGYRIFSNVLKIC